MDGEARRRIPWIVAILMAGFALFGSGLADLARLSWLQWKLERQLSSLAVERERLSQEQQRLESDPAYLEGFIRTTFKVAAPGEYVIPLASARPSASSGERGR
ncbi:MAG: hypothetical protein HYZ91_05805 [Candidatus Omnitrophica bacterium]|nr:hypothetical protein [Candidatus Omnitrophota bacterium]